MKRIAFLSLEAAPGGAVISDVCWKSAQRGRI